MYASAFVHAYMRACVCERACVGVYGYAFEAVAAYSWRLFVNGHCAPNASFVVVKCVSPGCSTSSHMQSVSLGRVYVEDCTCCHIDTEDKDDTCCLAQSFNSQP